MIASSADYAPMPRNLTEVGDAVVLALGGDHTLSMMCADSQGGRAGE